MRDTSDLRRPMHPARLPYPGTTTSRAILPVFLPAIGFRREGVGSPWVRCFRCGEEATRSRAGTLDREHPAGKGPRARADLAATDREFVAVHLEHAVDLVSRREVPSPVACALDHERPPVSQAQTTSS